MHRRAQNRHIGAGNRAHTLQNALLAGISPALAAFYAATAFFGSLAQNAIVFALVAFAAFLARFRAHLGLVEKAMGGLLVLTGIAFLTGTVSEVSYWLLDTFPMLGKIG